MLHRGFPLPVSLSLSLSRSLTFFLLLSPTLYTTLTRNLLFFSICDFLVCGTFPESFIPDHAKALFLASLCACFLLTLILFTIIAFLSDTKKELNSFHAISQRSLHSLYCTPDFWRKPFNMCSSFQEENKWENCWIMSAFGNKFFFIGSKLLQNNNNEKKNCMDERTMDVCARLFVRAPALGPFTKRLNMCVSSRVNASSSGHCERVWGK